MQTTRAGMTEASENFDIQDFLASLQFPLHEYFNDESEIIGECFPSNSGTCHSSAENADNLSANDFNLEELDEFLPDPVGELQSSDLSSDDESLGDDIEKNISEFENDDALISDGYTDISDFSAEDAAAAAYLPKDSKLLKSALSVNTNFQQKLSEAIERITNVLSENEIQMKKLQNVKNEEILMRTKEPVFHTTAAFLSPYFAEPGPIGMFPPSNEDTIAKLRNKEINAYHHPCVPWSYTERSKLSKAVYTVALDHVLKPLNIRLTFLKEKIAEQRKDGTLIRYQELDMKEEIFRIKYLIKQKSEKSIEEIIKEAGNNIDWLRVSAQFLEGQRSDEDCELMWNNYQSRFVNKKPFSAAENKKLKHLAKKYNYKNWDLIAEELQTGRTAFLCCRQYQSHLNSRIGKRGNFTHEESMKVLRVIEETRIGNHIPWHKVQLYIDGRSRKQIFGHYYMAIKETNNRSPWTKEEDAMLLACAKKFGTPNWYKAKKYLPNRTVVTIRHRYKWFLNPIMKIDPWTEEENFKFIELIKKYGFGKWREISKCLPGRPAELIYCQAQKLLTKDKKTNKIRFKSPEEIKQISGFPTAYQISCMKRRKDIIDSAYAALKSALEKIYYHLKTPITVENLSSISFPGLRMLQKELMKNKKRSISWNINMNWKTQFPDRRPEVYDNESRSDSEDEATANLEKSKEIESNWMNPQIIVQNSRTEFKEKDLEEDEKVWLQKVLHSKIEEQVNKKPSFYDIEKMIANMDLCTTLEYSLYEEYLQEQLIGSNTVNKEDDDNMNFVNGCNYKTSLPATIHHFIHPAAEDKLLVLPPSCTTLEGMDGILASDSMLRKTADLVGHSAVYLRYLLNLSEKKPKCVHCSQIDADSSNEKYEAVLDNMKSQLILPTSEMKKSAMVETGFPAIQLKECWCNELLKSKETVNILAKRFISLFMWPYLLQSVELTCQQTELLFRAGCYKYKKRRYSESPRGKRKGDNVGDEGCSKKKRRKIEVTDTETEEETDNDSDISCSRSTNMQKSQSQPPAFQDETEVICLSDTHEDFAFAEPMEQKIF